MTTGGTRQIRYVHTYQQEVKQTALALPPDVESMLASLVARAYLKGRPYCAGSEPLDEPDDPPEVPQS